MPIPDPGGSASQAGTLQNESFYQGLIQKYYGPAAAQQYSKLYSQYQAQIPPTPTESTAYQIFNPFFAALVTGEGVAAAAKAVASAIGAVSTTTARNLPTGIDLLGGVDVGHWLLRIGEMLLGIVLIAVGVAHVTKALPVATRIAKTAGAGALL